jgi:FixJ family two-component response regulator
VAKVTVISIIDDDESVREATKDLVRSLGYSAAAFASAEDYLRSESFHDTSVVISDIRMPGMSGFDLQERLVAGGHHTPIIFVTAFSEDNARARALRVGACGFLKKPFRDESLIECIDRALAARSGGELPQ